MADLDWNKLWEKPEPPPRETNGAVVQIDPARASRYVATALEAEARSVATAPEGTRNHTLNAAAFNMGTLVAAGHLDETDATATLAAAARAAGLDDREIAATLASGLRGGAEHPRHIPDTAAAPVPPVTVLDEALYASLWSARPILAHLHAFARARRTSPYAVLGVALARACCAIPPFVVLPALVGGNGSLNTFVGLVGPSGAGKGAAESAAADALDVGDIETHTTGSGEGIAHAYMRRVKATLEQHATSVLFSVPEIDTLTALADRRGATLLPELRRAWSGERLGFAYADPAKRLPVPAHGYRMGLVAGIQPGRGGALLDDTDAGTPQRFLWLPATDLDAPDRAPPCPDPMSWRPPAPWPTADHNGRVVADVCDLARDTIDTARLGRLRGDGEALDGHSLLTRLKVAAILGLLDGRVNVNDDDWHIAGLILAVSDSTREHVRAVLSATARSKNDARSEAEASRTVLVAERVEEAARQRASRSVMRALGRAGGDWVSGSELRRGLRITARVHFADVLTDLVETGLVAVDEVASGARYRLIEESPI